MYAIKQIPWPGAIRLVEMSHPLPDILPDTIRGAYVKVSGMISSGEIAVLDRDGIVSRVLAAGALDAILSITSEKLRGVAAKGLTIPTLPDPHQTLSELLPDTFPDDTNRILAQNLLDKHF